MAGVEMEGELPIDTFDSEENALRVKDRVEHDFPSAHITVLPKPELSAIGKVSIHAVLPLREYPDIMKVWLESLKEATI